MINLEILYWVNHSSRDLSLMYWPHYCYPFYCIHNQYVPQKLIAISLQTFKKVWTTTAGCFISISTSSPLILLTNHNLSFASLRLTFVNVYFVHNYFKLHSYWNHEARWRVFKYFRRIVSTSIHHHILHLFKENLIKTMYIYRAM